MIRSNCRGSRLHPSATVTTHHTRYQIPPLTYSTRSLTKMASPLKAAADPVERTASPYSNPYELSPKAKILASRTSNYHSTSLRMVTSSSFRIFSPSPHPQTPSKESLLTSIFLKQMAP